MKKGVTRQCLVTKDRGENPADKDITGCNRHADKIHTKRTQRLRLHIDETTCRETSTLNPLREESEMDQAGEVDGRWPERRQCFSFFPDSMRAFWVMASRTLGADAPEQNLNLCGGLGNSDVEHLCLMTNEAVISKCCFNN